MKLDTVLKTGLMLGALVPFSFDPVQAAGNPDMTRGIVADHCSKCHEAAGFKLRRKDAAVIGPSFRSIANQPAVYTRARLKAFLRQPHYPMTKFVLSPSDIDNLVAYIQSLREK